MHDAHPLLLGDPAGQELVDPVDDGRPGPAVDGRLAELPVPPLELAGDVAVSPGEVTEADRVDVHGVQPGQGVDQRVPGPGSAGLVQFGGGAFVPHDVPLDERHHVERRAVDRIIGAQPEGPGHRHAGPVEGGDHGVLTSHVVGRREYVADRRPPEGVGRPARSVTR